MVSFGWEKLIPLGIRWSGGDPCLSALGGGGSSLRGVFTLPFSEDKSTAALC